jgi:hypothetical protein
MEALGIVDEQSDRRVVAQPSFNAGKVLRICQVGPDDLNPNPRPPRAASR